MSDLSPAEAEYWIRDRPMICAELPCIVDWPFGNRRVPESHAARRVNHDYNLISVFPLDQEWRELCFSGFPSFLDCQQMA